MEGGCLNGNPSCSIGGYLALGNSRSFELPFSIVGTYEAGIGGPGSLQLNRIGFIRRYGLALVGLCPFATV